MHLVLLNVKFLTLCQMKMTRCLNSQKKSPNAEQCMIQHFIKYDAKYKSYHKTVIKKRNWCEKKIRHSTLIQEN